MNKELYVAMSFVVSSLVVGTTFANPIASDLPSNTYVAKNVLKWTWASPVNEEYLLDNVLSTYSFHPGWRFAADTEILNSPTFADFGEGAIQSTAYWNAKFTSINVNDVSANIVANTWGHGRSDTVYVSPVAEPSTYAMLLIGLGLLCFSARRRKRNKR